MSEPTIKEQVLQYAHGCGTIRPKQTAETLGLLVRSVKTALAVLVKEGALKKIGHGSYEYVEGSKPIQADVKDRVWRAMQRDGWTVYDIARLAGTTVDYVRKILREYRNDGLVEQAGRKPSQGSGSVKLWRLSYKAKLQRSRPDVTAFQPDPAAVLACEITKLVCTGLAGRYPRHAKDAAAKCEELGRMIIAQHKEDGDGDRK